VSSNLAELEIIDMLAMSTGQRRESSNTSDEWIKAYVWTPVDIEPGTKYRYSSMDSYML
jgi:hypothetical protein